MRVVAPLAVAVVLVSVAAGTGGAVVIAEHPQRVQLSSHDIANDNKVTVDERVAVYRGSNVAGYDVTVRNDASVNLNANVTVELRGVDGIVLASASREGTALTGDTITLSVRFDASHAPDTYGWVAVNVTTTTV